ncbi:MAG: hypothetical protein WCJ56_16335, partial [bacterium]
MFRSSLLRVWLPISLAVHITLLTASQLMHVFAALPLVPQDDTIQIVQLPMEEIAPPPPPPENIPPPPPDDVKVTDVTKPVAVDVKAPPAAAEVKPTYRTADSAKVPAESLPPPPIPGNSQSPMLPLPFTPGNSFSTLPDGPATPMLPQPGQVTTAPRMAMGIPGRVSLTPAQLGDGPAARGQVASNQISAATPSAGSLGGAPVMV